MDLVVQLQMSLCGFHSFSPVTMSILVTFSLKQVHACTRRAGLTTVQFIML
jgi:hypothetical protein